MYAPEPSATPADSSQRHLVDLQYEEVSKSRTAVLNRESVRLRSEGWNVRMAGDHLVATRLDDGRSQLERMLIGICGFLALAYAATIFLPDVLDALPVSEAVFVAGAAVLGATIAFFTSGQAQGERRLTVSVDGQGRPFVTEQGRDF